MYTFLYFLILKYRCNYSICKAINQYYFIQIRLGVLVQLKNRHPFKLVLVIYFYNNSRIQCINEEVKNGIQFSVSSTTGTKTGRILNSR